MNSKNNRAPLLCYFKLCASFHNHQWNQTWVTIWVKISPPDLGIWRKTLKNNRAPLPCYFKLFGQTDRCVLRSAWPQLKIINLIDNVQLAQPRLEPPWNQRMYTMDRIKDAPTSNGEVGAWMSNYIQQFFVDVIIYPCHRLKYCLC